MSSDIRARAEGTAIPLVGDDVDTDRIIPARFLKCVTFDALGPQVFYDDRFTAEGTSKGHPFDDTRFTGGSILVCGKNFGCGSSREHAPQALYRWGIRAIVGGSFAEIFFANSLALGIPCVRLDEADLQTLFDLVTDQPTQRLTVHASGRIEADNLVLNGHVPSAVQEALEEGRWDPLSELRSNATQVAQVAGGLPYTRWVTPETHSDDVTTR